MSRTGLSPADDADLLVRLASGESDALAQIYDRYHRQVFSLALRILGDHVLAEDTTQEVFLALWRDPGKFDPAKGGFASWLLSLAHHRSVDGVRREESQRRRRDRLAELESPAQLGEDPADKALERVVGADVRSALSELPAVQREALTLAYFGGYTQREVAALTGAPLGTVKTRMLAGMRRLRQILGTALSEIPSPGGAQA
ncbi:MAG: sigma-70 family RNA polymerase sigma factor [Actinomycetota bacterium]|nr:sigma-70 family RNA polymerase sigma factor [Actinomycetota bacterium]